MPRKRRRLFAALAVTTLAALGIQMNRTQLWDDRALYAGWRLQQHVVLGACRLLDRDDITRARRWGEGCATNLKAAKHKGNVSSAAGQPLILVHGMGRSTDLVGDLQSALRAANYQAAAISYPGLLRHIAGHVDEIEGLIDKAGHSLADLVVRELLSRKAPWQEQLMLARVVILAPPNHGSALAEPLAPLPPHHGIGAPSAARIAAGGPFAPLPEKIEVAVVAGGSGRWGFNPLLPGDDDGVVTVTKTELMGPGSSLLVPALHTVIAATPQRIAASLTFLEHGRLRPLAVALKEPASCPTVPSTS